MSHIGMLSSPLLLHRIPFHWDGLGRFFTHCSLAAVCRLQGEQQLEVPSRGPQPISKWSSGLARKGKDSYQWNQANSRVHFREEPPSSAANERWARGLGKIHPSRKRVEMFGSVVLGDSNKLCETRSHLVVFWLGGFAHLIVPGWCSDHFTLLFHGEFQLLDVPIGS